MLSLLWASMRSLLLFKLEYGVAIEGRFASRRGSVCRFIGLANLFGAILLLIGGVIASAQSSSKQRPNHIVSAPQLKQDEARLWALLAKDPNDAGALSGMAWIRSRQGNYLAAISFLERVNLRRPNDPSVTAALRLDRYRFFMSEAKTALATGDVATARLRYGSALEIFPQDVMAYRGLRTAGGMPGSVDRFGASSRLVAR